MKDTDYAYVAGLIDGEGSIHIEETKGKWYAPQVSEIRKALPRRTNGQSVWTEAAREKCRKIKQEVKELNRKGPGATAGSVEDA